MLPLELLWQIAREISTNIETTKSFRLVHSRFNAAALMAGLRVHLRITDQTTEEHCSQDHEHCMCYNHTVDWNEKRLDNLLKSDRLADVITLMVEIPWTNIMSGIMLGERLDIIKKTIETGRAPRMRALGVGVLPDRTGSTIKKEGKKAFQELQKACMSRNIFVFVNQGLMLAWQVR